MKNYLKDLKWGRFNLIDGDMISQISSRYGEWADVEVSVFKEILSEGDNVVEVGANLGLHSIPIAKIIGDKGKLICFEPQRIIYQHLCCNIALNSLVNVETYQYGVSDINTKLYIESTDYNEAWNYGSFSLDKGFSTEAEYQGVVKKELTKIIKLDDFESIKKLSSLDLIKADVEGFEIRLLNGAKNIIDKFKPFLFVECNLNSIANEIIQKINELGYKPYWIISARYQECNYFNAEQFERGEDFNLLCIPSVLPESKKQKISNLLSFLTEATSEEQVLKGEISLLVNYIK
ncbi:MAG: FkbM family methyltransferase [Fusobacteriaceae bacterium]|nr:FkbM family methyltransferase [Fusobacteriaceae bacterium]